MVYRNRFDDHEGITDRRGLELIGAPKRNVVEGHFLVVHALGSL